MQVTTEIIAVGKYKDKFQSTGVMLNTGNGDFWVDIKGNLDWKQYKGNTYTFEINQNSKGYWGGTIAGNTQGMGGPGPGRQQPQQGNQAGYQPQQQQPPPPQQRPQQNNVQDDIRFAQALNRACEEFNHNKIEENCIDERTNIYYRILQTRVFPMKMTHGHQQEQQEPPPQEPQQPQYGSNQALDDSVPF